MIISSLAGFPIRPITCDNGKEIAPMKILQMLWEQIFSLPSLIIYKREGPMKAQMDSIGGTFLNTLILENLRMQYTYGQILNEYKNKEVSAFQPNCSILK